MSVSVSETEAKYEAAPDTVLPRLDQLPRVARTERAPVQVLVAVYYDTSDLRLLRAGITLRRRTGGEDAGWHLKLPVSGRTREEVRLPLDSGPVADRVPAELADLVRARSRGAELAPVATVSTRRQVIRLLDAGEQVLAEVADDNVSALRAAQDPSSGETWREVEVELVHGDGDLLRAADDVLRQHGVQPSQRSAKLERVLASRLPAGGSPAELTTAASPARQVVTGYLAAQAEALAALDPQVRRFKPDSVHKMRVAARRLRAALRTFDTVLGPVDTSHVAGELKWLGEMLGQQRDAEVLEARMRAQQEQTDIALLLGPVGARIDGHFAALSGQARAAVQATLESERYLDLLTKLDAVIAEPTDRPAGDQAAGAVLPAAVRHSYRTTARRMRRALATPPGPDRDVALHQARKAAKRTRYAAEALTVVAGRDASRLAGQLKRVQSVLGEHQDTVVARQLARSLAVTAHLAGESAFSYGLFYERDACEARMLQDLAATVWRKASRRRYRRWL